jgi:hypothetical protein
MHSPRTYPGPMLRRSRPGGRRARVLAGHIGAGLAIGRAERDVNVGVFIAAALLLDVLLWLFVLLGWESVTIPPDFMSTHQARFVFPYSHGLLASLTWSVLAAVLAFVSWPRLRTRQRAGALVGAAVFSHWLLDALVHRPELPLAGTTSPVVGLGLWSAMPLALTVEAALVVAGLCLFIPGANIGRSKSIALAVLSLVVMGFTAFGMTMAPAPPSAQAMAASSLATLIVVCVLCYWFGTHQRT